MAPPPTPLADGRSGTVLSTIAVVINNLVGAGLLALPYTFYRASLVPGAAAMVATGLLNALSMLLLARSCELSGARSYRELAEFAFGKRAETFISAVMAVYTLGSCVSYIVLLGDALPELLAEAGDPATSPALALLSAPAAILPITAAAVLFPLALSRDLSSLRYTAGVSFLCILYTAGMVTARAASAPVSDTLVVNRGGTGVFVAIPITMVSFTMHYNTPKAWGELKGASLRSFVWIAAAAFGFALVVYEATATAGYALFGADLAKTKGDVLANFSNDDVPALVARIALAFVMCFSYPLAFNSFRASVTALLPKSWQDHVAAGPARVAAARRRARAESRDGDGEGESKGPGCLTRTWLLCAEDWPHGLLTAALIATTVVVGIAIPELEAILGYKGALGGTLIVYVFPAWMLFIFSARKERGYAVSPRLLAEAGEGEVAGKGEGEGDEEVVAPASPGLEISPAKPTKGGNAAALSSATPVISRSWSMGGFLASVFSSTKKRRGRGGGGGGGDDEDDDGGDESLLRRSHTPLLWGTPTPSEGGRDTPVSVGKRVAAPGAEETEGGGGRGPLVFVGGTGIEGGWAGVAREATSTFHGAVMIVFTVWGFTVMVLGTLTTSGVIQ
jgi:amino acid permease